MPDDIFVGQAADRREKHFRLFRVRALFLARADGGLRVTMQQMEGVLRAATPEVVH